MSDRDLSKLFDITSPCAQDWESMTGTDSIRFCEHCQLSVRNISAFSHKQLRKLLAKSGERLCVRYVPCTDDGQRSTPVLHRISRRVGLVAAGATEGLVNNIRLLILAGADINARDR